MTPTRLDWVTRSIRESVSLEEMRQHPTVAHYSIPHYDEHAGAGIEPSDSIDSAKLRIRGGELLVSRLNPRKQRVLLTAPHDGLALCSGEFVVLLPLPGTSRRFLYWRMLAEDISQHLAGRVQSVTRSHQRVDQYVIRKLWIDLPTLEEQQRIADYLDVETTRIDDLITEQQRIKHLLTERLSAQRESLLIGTQTSGQPGWECGRLKRFVRVARGRFTHRPRNDPALYGGDYPFIQTGDIAGAKDGVVRGWSQTLNELGLAASRLAPAGTIVMAIAANIGDVARLGFDACFPDSIVALSPHNRLSGDYLLELVRALRQELIGRSTLNTQLNINVERIGDAVVQIPPIEEQERLVAELVRRAEEVANVTQEVDRQTELLREHRQALITTAVMEGLNSLPGVA